MSIYKGNNLLAGLPDISGKANVSLNNLSSAGKSLAAGLGMPSDTYVNLTLGASGTTYTAVANGWVEFVKQAGGAEYMQFQNNTSGWFQNVNASFSGPYVSILAPVKKNDQFQINYDLTGSTTRFRFYYAEGSK